MILVGEESLKDVLDTNSTVTEEMMCLKDRY